MGVGVEGGPGELTCWASGSLLLAASVGRTLGKQGAMLGGGVGGGSGLCYHVAHPSVSRTRLMEGLSRSSMAGRARPRGEWNSFLCSSRSLPS